MNNNVSVIAKSKYIQMLRQRYISCLVNLNKDQINKRIKEIKDIYPNKMLFKDILITWPTRPPHPQSI